MANRFSRLFGLVEEGIIAFLLLAMVFITFAQVVLRYLFGTGLLWAVELTGYLFAWLVLIGAAYLIKHRGHLGVDLLVKRLAPSTRRWAAIIAVAFCLAYAIVLFVGAIQYELALYRIGISAQDVPVARWVLLLPVAFALFLLVIRIAHLGFQIWKGQTTDILTVADAASIDGPVALPRGGSSDL